MRVLLLLMVNMTAAGTAVAQGFAVHNQNGAGTGTNNPSLQVVRGSFDSAVDIFSVQLNHHF